MLGEEEKGGKGSFYRSPLRSNQPWFAFACPISRTFFQCANGLMFTVIVMNPL